MKVLWEQPPDPGGGVQQPAAGAAQSPGSKGHVSGGSQTGDTLGKALASVSYEPAPKAEAAAVKPYAEMTRYQHVAPEFSPSTSLPHYESSLISLSQVEDRLDRLDDVIHVLRNHAVGPTAGLPADIHGLLNQNLQGLLGSAGPLPSPATLQPW
ncbi:hypothetical protein F7725_023007 [Dissostichus mawsoni]|uniref:Uncharacterized protein n=1 Tax=Dissostichus mawsoni TaxID=36200 RepID=A0A7J5YZE8_DISMA|nr:hypothetical protein F7725_023007 [Dissostichus mawsoni]